MVDPDLILLAPIDFLHQRPHVSIAEGTVLLGWSRGEMSAAIRAGEVEVRATSVGKWMWREELMVRALDLWLPEVIEEALGADAEGGIAGGGPADRSARPAAPPPGGHARVSRRARARLGRRRAARELDDLASAHADELSWAVAGFADALAWPDPDAAPPPC